MARGGFRRVSARLQRHTIAAWPRGDDTRYDDLRTWSVDRLRSEQTARLRETVQAAYASVPHYRAAFDAVGLQPGDVRSLDDLARVPFTSKDGPAGRTTRSACSRCRARRSSGSTPAVARPAGPPSSATRGPTSTCGRRSWPGRSTRRAAGPGDIVHVAYGYGLFTGGLGAHYGAERLGCTVVPVSGGMTERQVQLIRDFEPRVIMVTPSYFLSILDEMERQGLDPKASSLRIGIFGAEPWTESMRREVEERTAMDAVDIYGLSEVIGPGVAQEAVETKDGLHIWEDHFYPEIVDPITGELLARRRARRAGVHQPHQAGHAGAALPHAGPHPPAARVRIPRVPPDGEDHRPLRRPDDRPRRQRVPHAGGGAGPRARRRWRRTSSAC